MWEIDVSTQAAAFVWAILLGSGLCLLYDCFRLLYALFRWKAWVCFLLDLFYWSLAALIVFSFFLLFFYGQLRGFVFLPILAGFLLFRFLISRRFFGRTLHLFRRLLRAIRKISVFIWNGIDKIALYWQKIKKKLLLLMKKLLKPLLRLVYNKYQQIRQRTKPQEEEA